MSIRKMTLEDYDQAKDLVYQVHELHYKNRPDIYNDGNPLPFAYFETQVKKEDGFNYVYEENQKICGLIIASKNTTRNIPISKKRTIYFIEDIVVDKKSRRKGIGKKLYNYLKQKAEEDNADSVELNVWAFNENALEFYKSLGMTMKNIKLESCLKKNK